MESSNTALKRSQILFNQLKPNFINNESSKTLNTCSGTSKKTKEINNCNVKILGVGRYLPKRIITNEELESQFGYKKGWIENKLGLTERRRADNQTEVASWMGAQAILEAVNDAKLQLKDIDLIINASGTPERTIPDNGPLIQKWLDLENHGTPAFSVHATCLSFLVALQIASALIESKHYLTIAIVSTEVVTTYAIDWKDPHTSALFGDASAAIILSATPNGEKSKLESFRMETFGSQHELATIRGGGSRLHPFDPKTKPTDNLFDMRGNELLLWSLQNVPEFFERFYPGITSKLPETIDIVIPHQPSGNGLIFLTNGLGWEEKKISWIFPKLGNTISASIPCALYEAIKSGKLKRGGRALICGTGSGLSIAIASLVY